MTTFRYPALRTGLALIAALLFVGSASAQSLQSDSPIAPSSAEQPFFDIAVPRTATSEATASSAAACTPSQTFGQTAQPTAASTISRGGNSNGQSFTAVCDGTLTQVAIALNPSTANPTARAYGVLEVYSGAGTAGPLLATQPFALAVPTGGFFTYYPLQANVPVVMGQVYTFFVRSTSGSFVVLARTSAAGTASPYAGGDRYVSTGATTANATPNALSDLNFQLTFDGTVATQTSTFAGAGWRLLSAPIVGANLQDLSKQNLVQGFTSQYPNAPGPNVLQNYTGTGTTAGFTAANAPFAASAAFGPDIAQGFFWYFYGQNITPDTTSFGGGTSRSRALPGFTLTARGQGFTTPFGTRARQLNPDGLYMLGNPFATPFAVDDVIINSADVTFGTLGTTFFVYDPAIANYRSLFTSNPVTNVPDRLAVWQGFFAQITGATNAAAPPLAFFPSPAGPAAPFYGRTSPTPYVQLMLDGTTATGAEVHDVTAYVRFTENGLVTWDADDATKLALPPGVGHALLAPVGVDEFGARARLAVNSFSDAATEAVTVPVDFKATEGGAFTVSWAGPADLPDGWNATLTDNVTNTVVDLRQAADYSFTADATAWTSRFTLVVTPDGVVAGEGSPDAVRVGTFAPNPATGASRLSFSVAAAQTVRAVVVDALGREVAVVFEGAVAPGAETTLAIDAGRLAPGTYVVRVTGETFAETRRLTVVR